ncbi:phage major capsid protein [Mycobacterium attenuatum]|uniref:phage major capsid protein n=1 Tax=Mycobacterium attenuatum TaxID=2341086 RepID=UPI000F1AD9CE|nr:phage major capsid protein [Mycobacterium attenuatum]VBA47916.1 hypothetical protein LAUMK41_00638 [Mycobacterium attenuatum]
MSGLEQNYQRLLALRAEARAARQRIVDRAERERRDQLTADESRAFERLTNQIEGEGGFDERIGEIAADIKRSGRCDPEAMAVRKATSNEPRAGAGLHDDGPWGRAAPIRFDLESLRIAHQQLRAGGMARLETEATRSFISGVGALLPSELFPSVVGQVHDNRILDRLPAQGIDAPSLEFIRHISSTGAPGVTAAGAVKPEVVMALDQLTAKLVKIAGHSAVPTEVIDDFDGFASYVATELSRQVVDVENDAFLNGPGGDGQVEGLLNTSGVLTHECSSGTTPFTPLDEIEIAISELRTGPALARPNLLVLHPDSWSAVRRTKDSYGRYLVAADPTADEANSVWGVPVLQTTQIAAGTGVLLDTSKFGRAVVRGPITVMIGWANDDFTRNLRRFVAEERVALATTRPAAVNIITELPTGA